MSTLMHLQEDISYENNPTKVGKTFKTVIARLEGDYYICRTEYDSPEVDPEMLIKADSELLAGEFLNVRVDRAEAFDLYGTVVDDNPN